MFANMAAVSTLRFDWPGLAVDVMYLIWRCSRFESEATRKDTVMTEYASAVEPGLLQGNFVFCSAISHFYSAILNDNLTMKNGKTRKTKMMYFALIFKLSFNMESDQNSDLWNFLHLGHQFLLRKYF